MEQTVKLLLHILIDYLINILIDNLVDNDSIALIKQM